MNKFLLPLFISVFAFLGILDAGYITYEKFSGQIPICNGFFKCGNVLSSPWSSVGPVPLSLLGLLFYATIFTFAVMAYLETESLILFKRQIPLGHLLAALGVFGAGFSLYLVYIMGVVLQAWCLYCLFSAANCLVLLLLTQIHLHHSR
jgi:uncharacterized membrane protein